MSTSSVFLSRRRFCAGVCQVAPGAALATMISGCGGSDSSPTGPSGPVAMLGVSQGRFSGSSVAVDVAGSALATVGGAVLVESIAGVFLVARTAEGSFTAVDAVCSHQSCTITGFADTTYVCPCHGSRYDRNGRVLAGPATASLRQFATSFGSGVVTINL
jgi:cytochrome b6-f complex iron-sulfur subunit